jgi:hypothetical protein
MSRKYVHDKNSKCDKMDLMLVLADRASDMSLQGERYRKRVMREWATQTSL